MRRKSMISKFIALAAISVAVLITGLNGQNVTYQPYIQPGDSGAFGPTDQ
jgi:hypothetical protein